MNNEHVLSNELLQMFQSELGRGNNWVAYNTLNYFLDKGDLYCFKTNDEAHEFASNNISDDDCFNVIRVDSIVTLVRQLPYAEDIHFNFTEKKLEELFQQFDWREAMYDPLHDGIEAGTEQERTDLAKMEMLLVEWEQLYKRNPEAALTLAEKYWEGKPMEVYKDDFINLNSKVMNEKNFDYLKDNLKYLGFGDKLVEALQSNLKEGKDGFTLHYSAEVNKKNFEATLQFRRSDSTEMYFLNSYKASLERTNGDTMEQTFYLNKGKGVTAKEAYNLLEGRAVHKELTNKAGEPYHAWIQLDFEAKDKHQNYEVKQFHEKYAYDVREAVSKFPIKELDGGDKEKSLLQSLQKGNIQAVTLEGNGDGQRIFIEANPQYKTINLYNEKMQRLDQQQRQNLMQRPEGHEVKHQGKEKDKSKELGEEGGPEKKQSKTRKMNDDKDTAKVGLIEKKRTATNKGLSI
jgi:hypothetical protein